MSARLRNVYGNDGYEWRSSWIVWGQGEHGTMIPPPTPGDVGLIGILGTVGSICGRGRERAL